jgi:hypothetical protein
VAAVAARGGVAADRVVRPARATDVDDLVASGFDGALLWVLEGNARARSFYVAHGWSPDGARHDWEGAPVLRMARDLRERREAPDGRLSPPT